MTINEWNILEVCEKTNFFMTADKKKLYDKKFIDSGNLYLMGRLEDQLIIDEIKSVEGKNVETKNHGSIMLGVPNMNLYLVSNFISKNKPIIIDYYFAKDRMNNVYVSGYIPMNDKCYRIIAKVNKIQSEHQTMYLENVQTDAPVYDEKNNGILKILIDKCSASYFYQRLVSENASKNIFDVLPVIDLENKQFNFGFTHPFTKRSDDEIANLIRSK